MSYKFTKSVGPSVPPNTDSGWLRLDNWAGGQITFQTTVAGSATYSVLTTNDDPNDLIRPVASPNWDGSLTGVIGATTNAYGVISAIPAYIKVTITAGTGAVSMTVIQSEG